MSTSGRGGPPMKCPHCTFNIHESWSYSHIRGGWGAAIMECPQCSRDILRLRHDDPHGRIDYEAAIYPQGSNRSPVPADVPEPIATDYNEAALVLPLSPKASAALSRRCLQAILRRAGYLQHDLAKQIDAVLTETDSKKSLPTGPHSMLDAIRNFGNFSAHPLTDKTTLQVIDVEDHEAEYCLDILDALFDHYYVKPAEAARRRAALDAKLMAAGKPPSK